MSQQSTRMADTSDSETGKVKQRVIPYPQLPEFSRLFLDSCSGKLPVEIHRSKGLREVAAELASRQHDRNTLADILDTQAKASGSDAASFESIERFRDPRSVVVIAGQQAGWYGGSLLSLIKALAVAKAAKKWSLTLGQPVVPVFWIAADDHDLDEIRTATLLSRTGQLVSVEYPNDQCHLSAGETILSDAQALTKSSTQLAESVGAGEFAQWATALIADAYQHGETFGSSFAKLFAKLTAQTGLVLFTPSDPALKRFATPWFEQAVKHQPEMNRLFQTQSKSLKEHGYHAQVEKREDASFLFHHAPAREPISQNGENWKTELRSWSTQELTESIQTHPERFSPDVITRPLLQSWLFPVIAQFGGPSEIAYLHQITPLFDAMSLTRPLQIARPGLTVIDRKTAELLESAQVSLERLLTEEPDGLVSSMLSESFPKEVQQELEKVRSDIRDQSSKLSSIGLSIDQQTSDFAGQTAGKIDYLIGQFEEKLLQAHRRKEKELRERWQKTLNFVAPNYGLQERTINTIALCAKIGPKLPDMISDAIDPDSPDHRLLII